MKILMLSGAGGTGKTTFLNRFIEEARQNLGGKLRIVTPDDKALAYPEHMTIITSRTRSYFKRLSEANEKTFAANPSPEERAEFQLSLLRCYLDDLHAFLNGMDFSVLGNDYGKERDPNRTFAMTQQTVFFERAPFETLAYALMEISKVTVLTDSLAEKVERLEDEMRGFFTPLLSRPFHTLRVCVTPYPPSWGIATADDGFRNPDEAKNLAWHEGTLSCIRDFLASSEDTDVCRVIDPANYEEARNYLLSNRDLLTVPLRDTFNSHSTPNPEVTRYGQDPTANDRA